MARPNTTHPYLAAARQRVLIYDGAMGTQIHSLGLTPADYGGDAFDGCPEILAVSRPDAIRDIHRAYLAAGADVVETDTFTGTRLKLDDYALGPRTTEINRAAAALARAAADEFATPDRPRFVAGSMGPTGMLPSSDDPSLSNITYQQLAELYREQAAALIAGGVDLLLIETSQDILEVRAAITGIRRAFAETGRTLPIQAQVTLDTSGRMLLGTDIAAASTILLHLGVNVIGLNCSTGPEHMREPVRYLTDTIALPISTIPNAGLPLNVSGKAVYPMQPDPLAEALAAFVSEFGVNIIGGCCGTTPEHISRIVARLADLSPAQRHRPLDRLANFTAATRASTNLLVASAVRATTLTQNPAPLLVGERVNAQGSRKVKQALLADDYDTLLQVAREQVDGGAHVLDVQTALTERGDEAEQMRRAVKKLEMGIEAPLVIDTTEASVVQAALETYPGRAVINSVNLENGRQRVDTVLPLAREHGSAVVALTIDEEGMAKTAERKLAIARRIHEIATTEYGLLPESLLFDALTFPVTTGQEDLRDSAVQTLDGIRRIKAELPGVLTILGVSNVSFGVAPHARAALNSVFLYHAVEAGLDAAIVNPAHITPYAEIPAAERQLCDDLLFNRDADALPRFIAYYEQHGSTAPKEERADPTAGMTVDQRIHYQILHRKKEDIESLVDAAVAYRAAGLAAEDATPGLRAPGVPDLISPSPHGGGGQGEGSWATTPELSRCAVDVLNNVLLPAMKDVGDRFGAGELILPFVLQSAEVMKKSVAHLEHYLERTEGYTKGRVVLATVFGDVHDIGKNLVNTILSNNGYTVYDLGKQVPLNTIIDKALEVNADAIGLSALLVSTSKQMPLCVQELDRRQLDIPVIVGGAAINRAYGRRILFVGENSSAHPFSPGVYYARDAFEGLELMDALMNPDQRPALVDRVRSEALTAREAEARRQAASTATSAIPAERPQVAPAPAVTPPFWGPRLLDRVAVEDVARCLDMNALYRGRWGGVAHGDEYTRLVNEQFAPRLERMLREARQRRWLHPRAVYGYFPTRPDGDVLLVLDPNDHARTLERFTFPRQTDGERLCLADYFATPDGAPTAVAFQVVTMGDRASEETAKLQAAGDYSEAYFLHGLSVQMAEAMADYVNERVRAELGFTGEQGRRYSWGYAAIPELADHERVFRLLGVPEAIGVTLTESYQLVPEQSTAAIIVPHPGAVYFAVR
ncbi:MAG: 5-methyltetrahydrofolate--homocysteine methyltransferase [Ktedonobacterales bacterium]|jgi:5-methyltetrahydrofolate--homocysteine methyltransferase|nr:MAG: 5-methyltetrahydrofolate--homocysteine methyltransferase [Ktedonobacterales bacterium]